MKTSELTGPALNYAVILAKFPRAFEAKPSIKNIVARYPYDTDWTLGGPIIERERIDVNYDPGDKMWTGHWYGTDEYTDAVFGDTPLIAAMRCFVASKLGDEVDIPKELL